MVGLNAHQRPPAALSEFYKKLRRLKTISEIESYPKVLDLERVQNDALPSGLCLESRLCCESLGTAFDQFMGSPLWRESLPAVKEGPPVYTHRAVPGLQIIPSLLPPAVQTELLSRLLHRDLSDERHQTNLHLHYHMSYPARDADIPSSTQVNGNPSFFCDDPSRLLTPKDPSVHRPLSIQTLLNGKLRWVTLGGQYNWTDKQYPAETPPEFPKDVATLLSRMFPDTNPEAAIVNVYSPGDKLSVHRDVSEECDTGLISISFGCEGMFMIGNEDESSCVAIRLRSGDAVYMAGDSRFAWHAVPKILPSTCPSWLQDWPGDGSSTGPFQQWQDWMAGKRVNLNVRQMKPKSDL